MLPILNNAIKIQEAIVSGSKSIVSKGGKEYTFRKFSGGTLKGLDVGEYRYVEQNPNTSSRWAKLAREGHKILWVIHIPTNKWYARVVDGRAELL